MFTHSGTPAIEVDRRAVAALCNRFDVYRLDLFGSAMNGRFDPERSDLDFLIEFKPMPPGAYATAYFQLRDALQTLFRRPIDLVSEPALANPYLRRRIEAERQNLFVRR